MKDIKLIEVMRVVANAMIEAEPLLTEFDSALGDGDCGMGMKTGFTAVLNALQDKDDASSADVIKATASNMISAVGGTSGAIYGTAFMRMAKAINAGPVDSLVRIGEVLQAGLDGAKMRGEDTKVGDKTLIDALEARCYRFQREGRCRRFPGGCLRRRYRGCQGRFRLHHRPDRQEGQSFLSGRAFHRSPRRRFLRHLCYR